MGRVNRRRSKTKRRKKRKRGRKRVQHGGALFRRKPTLTGKIAEGASMFLSGPAPSFATLGGKLVAQVLKGIKDNVKHYRRKR